MYSNQLRKRIAELILPFLFTLIGLLFSYINFSEYYLVKFGGMESAYAFGNINENQWYYLSASAYTFHCLLFGIPFFTATCFLVWGMFRNNNKHMVFSCIAILLLVVFQFATAMGE